MKQRLRYWSVAAVTLLSGLAGVRTTYAEGSRELTPNNSGTTADLTAASNTRSGYLIHDSNSPRLVSKGFLKPNTWTGGAGNAFLEDYRLYVRLKPNETLNYGVHRIYNGQGVATASRQQNLILTLRTGTGAGTIVKTTKLYRDSANTTANNNTNRATLLTSLVAGTVPQAGVIATAAQAQAGPQSLSNLSGYVPLTYTNNTASTQDVYVEFTQQGETGLSNNAKLSHYDFWDFTVKDVVGAEQKGRLFSKFWAFSSGVATVGGTGFENRLSATFNMYTLVPSLQNSSRYYVKQLELAGMRPVDFFFVANANGSNTTAGSTFAERRQSQTGETSYPEYLSFVNDPDISIWPSAPLPNFARNYQPFCNPILARGSAAFTTLSEETGAVSILIDLNNNGIKDGADVLIEQNVTTANQAITSYWNGLDASNNPVTTGTTIRLSFTSTGAPVNFPIFDAEGNPGGFRVQNVRPSSGGNTFYDRLYWDDTKLTTANATAFPATLAAPDNSNLRLDGVISTPGVHSWGDNSNTAGDGYTVNTWTYGFISAAPEQTYTFVFDCDFDNDGIADRDDKDDDNDGIPDTDESYGTNPQTQTLNGAVRTDGSGVLAYLDASYVIASGNRAWRDTNADGINDYFDLDQDGVPNHLDVDSDGDGLTDAIEANKGVAPTNYVAATGRINSPVGNNGMPASAENNDGTTPASSFTSANLDTDGDGIVNRFDRDSDNDGIPDLIEAQSSVAAPATGSFAALAGNGLAYRAPSGTDTDADGLDDAFDTNNGGTAILYAWNTGTAPNSSPATAPTLPDYLDLDSDNDGLTDAVESNRGVLPAGMSSSGRYTSITDVDRDGLQDNLAPYVSADQDGDVIPNFRDLDSDNDAIPDMLEANGGTLPANANYNGRVSGAFAGANDTDADGLINQFDTDNGGTVLANGNLDGDLLPNFLDNDSDGDGLSDMREANLGNLFSNDETNVVNPDGRFRFGYVQANDDDRDGIANDVDPNFATAFNTPTSNLNRIILDTDGDGRVDYLDLDSDNDGITDLREGPTTNDYRLPTGTDTDGDGIDNAFDNNQTGTIRPDDSDGVEVNGYDYRDINSDNDRFPDWTEGFDDNHDGKALDDIKSKATAWTTANPSKSSYYPLTGVPADQGPSWMFDADNDGTPNFLDPQSAFFRDDNANGLADLYDPAYGGSPSSAPRRVASQANADFRFQGQQTPLPVELLSFQARAAGRDALVTWATASEKDNARFEVERSTDGATFELAGTVQGKGTRASRSDYSFTDKGVGSVAGTHYYRLRQVDLNGTESTTEVRVVSFDGRGSATLVTVYPSPTVDNATLDLLALSKATYQVDIIGADGRRMLRFETTGGREVALPVAEFAKGTYLIRVSGQGQNYLVKLLKN